MRVPTLFTGPGFMGGGRVTGLFSTPDIAPTLIDAAGLTVPAGMEGRSVLPLVRDSRAEWRQDVFFQISETETGRALRTHRWKYGVTADYDHGRPAAGTYREAYLYDLDADPHEMFNMIGMPAFRAVADGLRDRLLVWIARIENGARPAILPAPEVWGRQLRPENRMLAEDYARDTTMGMNPGD